MKTKVKFLVNENGNPDINDIFAFFPEVYHSQDNRFNTSYSRIGQHCACSEGYARESRFATFDEYRYLKTELESIGYDLEILNK